MKKMFLLALLLMFTVSFTACKDTDVVAEEETVDTTTVVTPTTDSVETTTTTKVVTDTLTE